MPSEIADACLWGTVLDAAGTLLDEQVREWLQSERTGWVAVVQRQSSPHRALPPMCRLTCPSCTGGAGVMLYIAGGSASFTGQSTIDLPAANSGMFKDIVMFQARSIAAPVKFAGNAGATIPVVLNGIVYVPNSTLVTLATGNATFSAKAIVAQQIKVASPVTIG